MADATAKLKNYRQSPRKVRLIADLVRGKTAEHALALLTTLPKRASEPMIKLIQSAVANAQLPAKELVISTSRLTAASCLSARCPAPAAARRLSAKRPASLHAWRSQRKTALIKHEVAAAAATQ